MLPYERVAADNDDASGVFGHFSKLYGRAGGAGEGSCKEATARGSAGIGLTEGAKALRHGS